MIFELLYIILNVLSSLLIVYGLYYLIMSIFAFKDYKKSKIVESAPKTRFKVLLPCRNEEKVIKSLVESLKKQDYPRELYEICVVTNNSTDSTKQVVGKLNVRIIDCIEKTRCKADALRYAYNILKEDEFDAYVIFDADNIAHPNFLKKMNDAYNMGYKVAQGNRDSKNPSDSWISGSYAIYYWIQNLFFNRSRMNIKKSAAINGTGYMVEKKVIDTYGFDTKTLTEDIEFTAQCILNNIKIGYVEEAITFDEQPADIESSMKQRKRWSIGANKCLKLYWKQLLKKAIKDKNISGIDMIFNFMAPFIQVFSTVIMILILALKIIIQVEIIPLTFLNVVRLTGLDFGIIILSF